MVCVECVWCVEYVCGVECGMECVCVESACACGVVCVRVCGVYAHVRRVHVCACVVWSVWGVWCG